MKGDNIGTRKPLKRRYIRRFNLSSLIDWLHVAGFAGVIASLNFVALELTQARELAMADVFQSRADLKLQATMMELESESLLAAIVKVESRQPLTSEETRLMVIRWFIWMSYWENNYFQYKQGLLPEEQWAGSKNAISNFASYPEFIDWWANDRPIWPESLVHEIDNLLEKKTTK